MSEALDFAFLVYASRSGSTILARSLHKTTASIVVLPEFRLVEYILTRANQHGDSFSSNELVYLCSLDRQFPNLGLDAVSLFQGDPTTKRWTGRQTMETIATAYSAKIGRTPKVVVIKWGPIVHLAKNVVSMFPGSSFIHVLRDGRAAANSMLSTTRAYFPKEKMARGDIVYAARYWSGHVRRTTAAAQRHQIPEITVKYEEFVAHPHNEMERVVGFLLGPAYPIDSAKDDFAVSSTEESMHPLVSREPTQDRLKAWIGELGERRGFYFETAAKAELQHWGYPLLYENIPRSRATLYRLQTYLEHLYKSLVHYVRRGFHYAVHPELFMMHLALLRSRLNGK